MPHSSLESHRELRCLDKLRVRVELVEVPSNARELGPPVGDFLCWGVSGILVEGPLTGQVNPADALSVLDLDLRNDPVLVVDKSLQCILK